MNTVQEKVVPEMKHSLLSRHLVTQEGREKLAAAMEHPLRAVGFDRSLAAKLMVFDPELRMDRSISIRAAVDKHDMVYKNLVGGFEDMHLSLGRQIKGGLDRAILEALLAASEAKGERWPEQRPGRIVGSPKTYGALRKAEWKKFEPSCQRDELVRGYMGSYGQLGLYVGTGIEDNVFLSIPDPELVGGVNYSLTLRPLNEDEIEEGELVGFIGEVWFGFGLNTEAEIHAYQVPAGWRVK